MRSSVCVLPVADYDQFAASFSHIFVGPQYAAGYVGYLLSESWAADIFSVFEEKGIFDQQAGNRFKATFLESGGTRAPIDLFIEFCGRRPSIEALMEQKGIIQRRRQRSESPLSQHAFMAQRQNARLNQDEAALQTAAGNAM